LIIYESNFPEKGNSIGVFVFVLVSPYPFRANWERTTVSNFLHRGSRVEPIHESN